MPLLILLKHKTILALVVIYKLPTHFFEFVLHSCSIVVCADYELKDFLPLSVIYRTCL